MIVVNDKGLEFVISKELEMEEREVFDYTIGIVNLIVELCKANA